MTAAMTLLIMYIYILG